MDKKTIGVLGLLSFGSWIGFSGMKGSIFFLGFAIFFGFLFLGGTYMMFKNKGGKYNGQHTTSNK